MKKSRQRLHLRRGHYKVNQKVKHLDDFAQDVFLGTKWYTMTYDQKSRKVGNVFLISFGSAFVFVLLGFILGVVLG